MSEAQAKYYYEKIKTSHFSSVSGILRLNDDTLLQKLKFYKQELDFSTEKVLDDFRLLTYDTTSDENSPSSVRAKIKYFREELDFSNRHFAIAVTPFSNDLEYLKKKVAYLKKTLGFEAKQIQAAPSILNLSQETLDEKIAFYKKELGFTSVQFKNTPNLFDFDVSSDAPTSIKSKIKFYKEELGFDESQFRISPSLLTFDTVSDSPTSVKTKVQFYKDTFGFENKHFQQSPVLLGLDCIIAKLSLDCNIKFNKKAATCDKIVRYRKFSNRTVLRKQLAGRNGEFFLNAYEYFRRQSLWKDSFFY